MSRSRVPTAADFYFSETPRNPGDSERLERDFFGTIQQSNGTFKYTRDNRLADLDELVAGLLPPPRPLRIMDVAVSSGISTLEWSRMLDRLGIEHKITAGDLSLIAYLIEFPGGLKALVDKQGYPLQYDLWGHAVPNPPRRRILPLVAPGIALCRLGLALAFRSARAATGPAHGDRCKVGRLVGVRAVRLVSPRLLAHEEIEVTEDDILHDVPALRGQFHVVRAANILNRDYFSDETLIRMVSNLRNRLVEGGLLIVCTTTGDLDRSHRSRVSNDGTVFSLRKEGHLEAVARLGAGLAVEDIVLHATREPTQGSPASDR
jgi:hypothetical protein